MHKAIMAESIHTKCCILTLWADVVIHLKRYPNWFWDSVGWGANFVSSIRLR